MGYKLVDRVMLHVWPRLPNHTAARVLAVMAWHAKDTDPHPMYFRGSAHLARALAHPLDAPAGERAVRRALAALVREGLIEQLAGTPTCHNRRWLLNIPTWPLDDARPDDPQLPLDEAHNQQEQP